jgi:elongation of very long chain fatty acids protein 4
MCGRRAGTSYPETEGSFAIRRRTRVAAPVAFALARRADQGHRSRAMSLAAAFVPLCAFGAYGYATFQYAFAWSHANGIANVDAQRWIGELSFKLPLCATIGYLCMCAVGPRVMAKRQAMDPKGVMLAYNAYQTAFNVFVLGMFIHEVRALGLSAWGAKMPWSDNRSFKLLLGIWLHYNNKYLELLDTAFMIARKKTNQLSFLHVYHHALLIWAWWLVCHLMATNDCIDAYFGAACNSFIHIVMYSYYLMAALGVKCPWKRYITQAQMLQFVIVFAHAVFVLRENHCPTTLPWAQMFVMANMLVLFGNFYLKSYSTKTPALAAAPAAKPAATSVRRSRSARKTD